MSRCACFAVALFFLGCQSLPVEIAQRPDSAAERLWLEGQAAMQDGQPEVAINRYEQSLAVDPERPRTWLSLAAAELEKGDEKLACCFLSRYVAACPHDVRIRAYYAELLLRIGQTAAARREFERYDAAAPDQGPFTAKQLVHCHSRLTKIAAEQQDEYAEHLHRGIGLYLLGQARAKLPDPDGDLSAESLLCKAASELSEAQQKRPEEARPCWYLYEIWSHLGQQQPAQRWLRAASDAAPFSYLTPHETRKLQLAAASPAPGR